jgi:hypothetical protein
MKKTLLCFLFLLPTLIFAQISSIIHCAGDNVFDLTSRYDQLTKNISLNPGESITIKYYTKDIHAVNDILAVSDPKNFVFNEWQLSIYANIYVNNVFKIRYSYLIILNPALSIYAANVTNPICGNQRLSVAATGGGVSYKYSLDGVNYQSESVFDNVIPGTYNIHVKDNYDCIATREKVINPITPLTGTILKIDNTCFGSKDGRIEVTPIGGIANYSYSKDGGAYQASNIFSNLAAGYYNITIKDGAGCLYTFPVEIQQPPILSAFVTATNVKTTGGNDGEIIVTASGGIPNYYYRLNNLNGVITDWQSSNTFKNLTAGNYIVEVIDVKGCMFTKPINVSEPLPPSLSITADVSNISCENSTGTITLFASGGYGSYSYSIDGINYHVSNTFSNLIPGSYNLYVKDGSNSIASLVAVITPYTPLTASATATKIENCSINYSSTIKITATGGELPYQYAVNSNDYQQSDTFFGAAPGTHIINVKDGKGCVFTSELTIASPVALTASVIVSEAVICGGNSLVTINASGGQQPYSYSFYQGSSYSNINTAELSAGYYTLFAKDDSGCIVSQAVTVAPSTAPSATLISSVNATGPNSNDGIVMMNVTDGTTPYSYSIVAHNGPIGDFLLASNVFTISNLAPGIYDITVKDAKGCLSQTISVVIEAPLSTLTATADVVQPNCTNEMGIITVIASGGTGAYQYSFDNGNNYSASNSYMVFQPGNYTIFVRDANNAVFSFNASVVTSPPLVLTGTIVSNVSCRGNGIIMVDAIGGKYPYAYSINGASFSNSTNVFSDLAPGIYSITVKDANGCMENITLVLETPQLIAATAIVENQTVTINASGGNAELKYAISPNLDQFSNQNVFFNLTPGNYTVIVQDAIGCYLMLDLIVDPPAPIIDGKTEIVLEFKSGQTLGDLVIEGENINWYSTPGTSSTGKTRKAAVETPLPLSTVLVDGVTYYASQTINGIESKERLAVTAKLNGSLSNPDFDLTSFQFYPNPVKHILSVKNKSAIEDIQIFSVSGQSVISKKLNSTEAQIDLSHLASGLYILNIKSDGKEKAVKFIKE